MVDMDFCLLTGKFNFASSGFLIRSASGKLTLAIHSWKTFNDQEVLFSGTKPNFSSSIFSQEDGELNLLVVAEDMEKLCSLSSFLN